jgi:hypothetical protein
MGKWTETLDWTGMTSKNSKMKRPVTFVQNGMISLLLFLVDEKLSAATGHTASAGIWLNATITRCMTSYVCFTLSLWRARLC